MSAYQSFFKFSSSITKFLARPDVCVTSAFAYGFFSSFDKKFIKEPLSQMFSGSIIGIIYSIGGDIVASMMPIVLRPIIPIVLNVCTVNHVKDVISEKKIDHKQDI